MSFKVSDESINCYGYRVLTKGIDTTQFERNPIMLFNHKRLLWDSEKIGVVGRWENLKKKGTELFGDEVIDDSTEFGKQLKDKVENDFIRMASIGIDIVETSSDPKHMLPGQTRPTVTKSILREISITDMGGNDNALKLYNGEEELNIDEVLPKINLTKNDRTMNKVILTLLGLNDEATENQVEASIKQLQKDNQELTQKVEDLNTKLQASNDAEAETLVNKAVELGLINESMKSMQLTALKSDFENQKAELSKLIEKAEERTVDTSKNEQLANFTKGLGGGNSKGRNTPQEELTYDYLQKHNPVELKRIKAEEPEKYAELAKDYANGVRYKKA